MPSLFAYTQKCFTFSILPNTFWTESKRKGYNLTYTLPFRQLQIPPFFQTELVYSKIKLLYNRCLVFSVPWTEKKRQWKKKTRKRWRLQLGRDHLDESRDFELEQARALLLLPSSKQASKQQTSEWANAAETWAEERRRLLDGSLNN